MTASLQPRKSTNVRPPASLLWTRRGVSTLSVLAPDAAARAAAHLFFRTRRVPARREELDVLEGASRFTVPFRGEELAAWSWGTGPTVLLVHGWNGRATQLGALVSPLVSSGFRVVAFDHVGHGASTGSSTTMVEMAAAIASVARAAGGVHGLVAHSLGAGASALAIAEGLALERVVLIAPPLTPEPWFRRFGGALGLDERAMKLARAAIERRVGRTFDDLHLPTLARSLDEPALIIHDRDDREIPIEAGELLSYAWQGSRLLVTAGLGHHRILRSPGVVESTRRFLRHADEDRVRVDPGHLADQ